MPRPPLKDRGPGEGSQEPLQLCVLLLPCSTVHITLGDGPREQSIPTLPEDSKEQHLLSLMHLLVVGGSR